MITTNSPFYGRPKKHVEHTPRLPTGPLLPSDTQAVIALGIEQSALDVLKRHRKVAMQVTRRPAPGVREIAAYDVAGELIGVSVVCGWSNE